MLSLKFGKVIDLAADERVGLASSLIDIPASTGWARRNRSDQILTKSWWILTQPNLG